MNESNLDILITRVVDRRAAGSDWLELEALAAADPAVWRELAMAQKDESALSRAVAAEVSVASAVEVPDERGVSEVSMRRRLRQVATWGGWAAAAAVGLAMVTNQPAKRGVPGGSVEPQMAGVTLPLSDVLGKYLEQGKQEGTVVGELPDKIVLDSMKTADGKTEIVFVRQIVERARVDDLYKMTTDEAGNRKPVKVRLTVEGRKSAL